MDALRLYGAATEGITAVIKWRTEFMSEFGAPLQMMKARALFKTLPPQVKQAMQQADPEQYAQLLEKLQQKGGSHA